MNHPSQSICVYPCPSVVLCSFSIRIHWCPFVVLFLPLPAPGGLPYAHPMAWNFFLSGSTGRLRARRAHASERRICITVGASPGGRRTYGPKTPTHTPARRAALQDLSQPDDFPQTLFKEHLPHQRRICRVTIGGSVGSTTIMSNGCQPSAGAVVGKGIGSKIGRSYLREAQFSVIRFGDR